MGDCVIEQEETRNQSREQPKKQQKEDSGAEQLAFDQHHQKGEEGPFDSSFLATAVAALVVSTEEMHQELCHQVTTSPAGERPLEQRRWNGTNDEAHHIPTSGQSQQQQIITSINSR